MTPEPRFLALVAKVDGALNAYDGYKSNLMPFLRALKVAIMAHEPDEDGNCKSCLSNHYQPTLAVRIKFPCKPFLDIESEVGK